MIMDPLVQHDSDGDMFWLPEDDIKSLPETWLPTRQILPGSTGYFSFTTEIYDPFDETSQHDLEEYETVDGDWPIDD
ncbi:hypothetical protein C2134_15740 [Chromobacterium sinusclupearum]|uniref:Uncharacterized protein n=2 Tax=Chromobacterium sinusclupearum TaxID=2077146 RepID=A0A2K4MJL7_9NEIS|nr:hypothetical protein C2134_15740 [Chromobacterium sinusclupearum]